MRRVHHGLISVHGAQDQVLADGGGTFALVDGGLNRVSVCVTGGGAGKKALTSRHGRLMTTATPAIKGLAAVTRTITITTSRKK